MALKNLLPRFLHLIQSTAEWIRAFEKGIASRTGSLECWLVTGDVVAFYTNIDTGTVDRSMEALLSGSCVPIKRAIAIAQLVKMTMHNNFFAVNDGLYRQTNGLAMGSPCSGTIANLVIACRERACIKCTGILSYVRYINDIFALLEARSITEVRHILQELSDSVAPLQIKWNMSKRHAIYLDVEVEMTPLLSSGRIL